ncbi:MAG: GTP cyclohydrolase I FolE [Deltaproteobacteria bacterium]|nr:GTP cyclohydrolase I FolE [Deltaproteobacteria bacterium]
MENLIQKLLIELGEDTTREGLQKTPGRVAKSLKILTEGYHQDLHKIVNDAFFEHSSQDIILVKDIDLFSLCEHHMLPFYGKCHVAYIPQGKIIGLSKMPRIVNMFSRRLQVQERLTKQISEALMEILRPQGVGVVIEAEHLCMKMRGVEKQNSKAITSSMLGIFHSESTLRQEFLNLIH